MQSPITNYQLLHFYHHIPPFLPRIHISVRLNDLFQWICPINDGVNLRFDGQTVIVTGAAHGFGRAIAHAFARDGAQVYACDVQEDGLEVTARLAADAGTPVQVRRVDVTDPAATQALMAGAARDTGRVDVLVNNAGGVLGQVGRPLEEDRKSTRLNSSHRT